MSPFVQLAIVTPLVNIVSFPLLATIYSLPLLWPDAQPSFKLQAKCPALTATVKRSLYYHFGNSALTLVASILMWRLAHRLGIHCGPLPPWHIVAGQLIVFIIVDDLFFYALHRLLHTRLLYRTIHRVHHRIHAPIAFTGAIMHPLEWLLVSSSVMLGPLLLGANIYVLWIWVFIRQWGNAEFHSGFVGPWQILSRLSLGGGTRHHDVHHARVHGNFAIMFPLWDRVFGTALTT
jgi:sterol desaturase/sphingolipid hydroxylase (fatty acid hydroxylase superfamily)